MAPNKPVSEAPAPIATRRTVQQVEEGLASAPKFDADGMIPCITADADGGELTGLAGYVVFRAEGSSSFVPVDSLQADAREYRDTGLRPLTSYSYRVLAYDEVGNESAVSNTAQIQTMGVTVPLNLTAVAGIARIELTWKAVEDPELLGYNLYRSILCST